MGTDGTVEGKDTSGVTQDTSGGKQETSGQGTETFTREQVEAISRKAANDALSAAGRDAKALEAKRQAIKEAEEHLAQSIIASREAEIESVRDDPEALAAMRKRHNEADRQDKLDKKERELYEKTAEVDEALGKVTKAEIEERAKIVAAKHDVDGSILAKNTDGSLEAMETLAKSLTKLGKAPPPITTDSGKTIGGGSMPNNLEAFKKWQDNLTQAEFEANAPAINQRLKELRK